MGILSSGHLTFDIWPFVFVKSNIPVLHSLRSEGWQNYTKIPGVYSKKKKKFWKHQNRVILAIKLLILRIWVILKTSMTSMNMIASLNSMTSTSSVASKNQKQHVLYILSYFPDIRNLSSLNDLNSFNNLGGLNDFYSLNSSKNLLSLMFPSTLTWHILVS